MMKKTFQDAWCDYSGNRLQLGNRHFTRTLDLSDGIVRTIALTDGAGRAFAAEGACESDFYFIGLNRPGFNRSEYQVTRIEAEEAAASLFDGAHLHITLEITDAIQQLTLRREFFVYPELAALGMRNSLKTPVMPNCYWTHRESMSATGWRNRQRFQTAHLESSGDAVTLAGDFTVRESISFTASTDYGDDLVHRIPAQGLNELMGNLCYAEASDGAGLFYLQEAPPEVEKRDFELYDFRVAGSMLRSCTWGIAPQEVRDNRWMHGYRHVLGVFHDAEEKDQVLKDYLAIRFPSQKRHRSVMVNAWGCGQFPSLVSQDFLCDEVTAAAEMGATHYQVDDSWQEGEGLADMSMRNRLMTPAFWQISERRMDRSFGRVRAAADAANVELALWIAPSSNAEYRDWEVFSKLLLDFHQKEKFNIFKIDGVLIRTYEAEENLERMLHTVRSASDGDVYFNLDTTNGQRPGYFQFLEYGNIFLENRYVCHEWGVGYHPEKTLRSLWKLSHFMRAQTLQIEVPYTGDVKPALYRNKGMCDPRVYSLEYWASLSLFASPLLWLAPSRVSPEDRKRYKAMMELHLQYRDAVFAGRIRPVGSEPNGSVITGFYSDSGYLVAYRERGAYEDCAEFAIPEGNYELIAGAGEVSGRNVRVIQAPGFAFFKRK